MQQYLFENQQLVGIEFFYRMFLTLRKYWSMPRLVLRKVQKIVVVGVEGKQLAHWCLPPLQLVVRTAVVVAVVAVVAVVVVVVGVPTAVGRCV